MKILKLHFKNIQSLKDEHVIHFDEEPLASAGLFLISGPTGSGKSTILDVITLALYNEVPRFGTISKNDIIQYGSIITHHTRDAFAEIHYYCKGVTYASKWSLAKNRNDNFNEYHMELWNLSENRLLDYKRSEVKDGNAKIIGLNYEQFVKSILLSQGEFAQFLKAPHTERAELLEKITGTEIYRKLGKAAFEKHKNIKEQVEKNTALYEHLTLLDESEESNLQSRLSGIDNEIIQSNSALQSLQLLKNNKDQFDILVKEQIELEAVKKQLEEKQNLFDLKKGKMVNYEKVIPLRGDISLYHDLVNRMNDVAQQYQMTKIKIDECLNKKNQCIAQIKSLLKEDIEEVKLIEKLLIFESDVKSKWEVLSQLQKQGESVRHEISLAMKQLDAKYRSWYDEKVKPTIAMEHLNTIRTETNQFLSSHHTESNVDISVIVQSNELLLQKINTYTLAFEALKQYHSIEKEILNHNAQIAEKESTAKEIIPQIEKAKNEQSELEVALNDLRIQKEATFIKQELSDYRNQLEDGQPCPLCGALEHPYCIDKHIVEIGTIEVAIREKEVLYKNSIQTLLEKNTLLSTLNSNIVAMKNNIQALHTDQSNITKRLTLMGCDQWTIEALPPEIDHLNTQLVSNRQIIQNLELNKKLMPIIEKYEALDQILRTYLENANALARYGKADELLNKTALLKDEYQSANEAWAKWKTNLLSIEKQRSEYTTKVETLGQSLHVALLQLELGSLDQMNEWLISEVEYNALRKESEAILLAKEQWLTRYTQVNKQFKELPEHDFAALDNQSLINEINDLSLKKDNTLEEKGNIIMRLKQNDDNKSKMKEAADLIAVQKKDLIKWEMLKQFIGDAQGKVFANYAQELTLNHIIFLANVRLKDLTDRYIITHKNNDLYVVDQYLGNIERSVKTLSGGESFIMSLALALSLSDLASRQIRLDCLFIDEGFGTLDDETLDTVIGTLEKLQQESEKTIGIISHVDSLKERILCQIQLKKNVQGLSNMKIS